MAATAYDPESPDEQPVPLPSAPLVTLAPSIVLQPPLSRRGHGPGLIVFLPSLDPQVDSPRARKLLDPAPVQKWAEEGFAVVGITSGGDLTVEEGLRLAVAALAKQDEVDIKDKIGVLVYDPQNLLPVLNAMPGEPRLVCIVSYGAHAQESPVPLLSHIPETQQPGYHNTPTISSHKYPTSGTFFVLPRGPHYHARSAALSHTRSLVFLRQHCGGPYFDIEAIWEEHMHFEFETRSLAKTMGTMVAEPYVNHVPTMTGGTGRKELSAFYRDHFIFSNPTDIAFEPVSRTVGADRIIDEYILTMTHDRIVDCILPGVPPSGRKVAIPMISVVNVRGDRLHHEHIWWDQAGALKQVGVIPTHTPYPLPDGKQRLCLPIAGAETARLLADETDGRSNEMLGEDWGVSSV
ncbi:hypothetical protein JB92DRAFT_2811096 [Gautieria morchelliformis]|nr:hypothetical protein JB92DRAFT_2811096 [Gautieria morchelliformis]